MYSARYLVDLVNTASKLPSLQSIPFCLPYDAHLHSIQAQDCSAAPKSSGTRQDLKHAVLLGHAVLSYLYESNFFLELGCRKI
jgi:hypothetical protein